MGAKVEKLFDISGTIMTLFYDFSYKMLFSC